MVVVLAAAVVHAVVADGMNFDVVLSVIIAVLGCLLLVLYQVFIIHLKSILG